MPGITGIFGLHKRDENGSLIHRMSQPMLHEDFYSSGTYASRESGIFSAFVGADSARPPSLAWNEGGNIGCFISGEPVIGSSDAAWPGSRGHRLAGDASAALVGLYQELGLGAFEKLNGWFSGLLVDLRQRQAVLFNDRYGLNRIYIHEEGDRLFFSSEAKSLLAVLPALRELDPRGLAEWFSCGCALGNRTLFRGVSLLPPGSAWIFSADGRLKKQTYFNPSAWENHRELSPTEYSEQLQQTFPRLLSRYLNGSRPVAMSLTGGLDGRMIMAWAHSNRGELPCYTFNGTYRDCADVRIARKVAAACGQPHQTIMVGNEFLAQFPRLAEQCVRITDGAMDVTGAAELYVNRLARQIAPVRLTGNYGSEILRRYVAFRPHALPPEMFSSDFLPQLAATAGTYAAESAGNRLSFIAFKQVPWHHHARLAIEQSQISVRSPYLDNDLVALAFRAPSGAATSLAPSLRLIAEGNPLLGQIPTDRGITYPADRMTNRMNRSIQEFLAKAEYAYDYGMPNWLARVDNCFAPFHFERLFLGRQKFVHFRTWYRHQLADYVKQVLLDPRSRSRAYLNGPALERLVSSHASGRRNCTVEIHKLLTAEIMQRQ
ncbi:MAG: asparagine synthase-related protein, partial [Verrucomicrobiota bacterium]